MRLAPGQEFAGYRIVSRLGRGGMATVYLVREPGIERLVALKVMPEEVADDPHFAARFEQEARIIASLDHPSIVPLYRYGVSDGIPWMALRFVDGGDLAARLASKSLTAPDVLPLLRSVAAALDHAHRKGVVHRDLKPQNVLVARDGAVYLADFGVAKLLEGASRLKTITGGFVGTPAYMAPEQALGQAIGPRTDVYAFAVMCFQWLAGHLPFDADTPAAVLLKHVEAPLPAADMARLHPAVAKVLRRGLAKDPGRRHASPSELIEALAHALAQPQRREPLFRRWRRAPRVRQARTLESRRAGDPLRARRARRPMWLALALLLTLGSYASWRLAHIDAGTRPPTAAAASATEPR